MKPKITILLVLFICFTTAFAAESSCAEESSRWLQTYYVHPQPDKFSSMNNLLIKCGVFDIDQKSSQDIANKMLGEYVSPMTFFAARIFADNPEKITQWMEEINFTNDYQLKIFYSALWESDTGVGTQYLKQITSSDNSKRAQIAKDIMAKPRIDLMQARLTPEMLDALWASFFATGESKYVERIISALSYSPPVVKNNTMSQEELVKMFTYRAAEWSLGSNMKQDPNVLDICKKALPKLDKQAQTTLNSLLIRSVQ